MYSLLDVPKSAEGPIYRFQEKIIFNLQVPN